MLLGLPPPLLNQGLYTFPYSLSLDDELSAKVFNAVWVHLYMDIYYTQIIQIYLHFLVTLSIIIDIIIMIIAVQIKRKFFIT